MSVLTVAIIPLGLLNHGDIASGPITTVLLWISVSFDIPLSPSLRSAQRLLQWPTAKSKFLAFSTCSFISAINGETASVTPSNSTAGSW